MSTVYEKIRKRVEEQFKSRSESNPKEFGKAGSKRFLNKQAEFFTGAMAALVAVEEIGNVVPSEKKEEEIKEGHGRAMSPKWVFGIMRGDILYN